MRAEQSVRTRRGSVRSSYVPQCILYGRKVNDTMASSVVSPCVYDSPPMPAMAGQVTAAACYARATMQQRKLGQSPLAVTPLALGGNVFGWTADEPTSFAILDAFVAHGGNAIDTADGYSYWVPGPPRRRERDRDRPLAEAARPARRRRHRHEGRLVGEAQGPQARQHHRGLRRLAAPARRRDASTSIGCTATTSKRARRISRCARHARQSRQGARRRRVELRRCALQGSARARASGRAWSRSSRSNPSTAC